jgi:hypothetical protein
MRIVTAAVAAALLAFAVPAAQAATPETGEASAANPVVSWSGEAYGYPGKLTLMMQTHEYCELLLCDSFTLTVKDPGHLKVDMIAPGSAQYVDVLVTFPDGTTEFLDGNGTDVGHEMMYPDAQAGTYMFDIWPNEFPVGYNGQYNGTAELCVKPLSECFLPPPEEEEF